MTDEDIITYYKDKHIHNWNNIPDKHKEYLNTRFSDSCSYKESIWRIIYNIETRPVCQICGKPVKFIGRKKIIFNKTCSNECFRKSLEKEKTKEQLYYESLSTKEKTKYTCQQKYGVDNPAQLETNLFKKDNPQHYDYIKEKTKATRINKYNQYMSPNNISILLSNEVKQKRLDSFKKTMLNRYNDITYRNTYKHKQTCINKYGVDSYSKTKLFKQTIKDKRDIIQNKINKTKQNNNSFNVSLPENESYILIKDKYSDVIRQYKSNDYPFICDFYIPSLDLYIECNYHWTHGGHHYNEDNREDQLLVEKWKQKNTKFYDIAINTWTVRDVNKRNIAKDNNLNYMEFWNINELKEWLNSL